MSHSSSQWDVRQILSSSPGSNLQVDTTLYVLSMLLSDFSQPSKEVMDSCLFQSLFYKIKRINPNLPSSFRFLFLYPLGHSLNNICVWVSLGGKNLLWLFIFYFRANFLLFLVPPFSIWVTLYPKSTYKLLLFVGGNL